MLGFSNTVLNTCSITHTSLFGHLYYSMHAVTGKYSPTGCSETCYFLATSMFYISRFFFILLLLHVTSWYLFLLSLMLCYAEKPRHWRLLSKRQRQCHIHHSSDFLYRDALNWTSWCLPTKKKADQNPFTEPVKRVDTPSLCLTIMRDFPELSSSWFNIDYYRCRIGIKGFMLKQVCLFRLYNTQLQKRASCGHTIRCKWGRVRFLAGFLRLDITIISWHHLQVKTLHYILLDLPVWTHN